MAKHKFSPQAARHFPTPPMDLEKDKDSANQADNSGDVVTKATSAIETQDAIVYPNVFWTSCVSFGVALGLFLVIHRQVLRPVYIDDANVAISGGLGHGKYG